MRISLDKYFGDTANVKFGRLTASTRPLFRASRPGYEKTLMSIDINYRPTQKASHRIKRVLIHILSGHVLELIATGIFYEFKAFTRAKYILSNVKGLKSHPIHDFKQKKTFHIKE